MNVYSIPKNFRFIFAHILRTLIDKYLMVKSCGCVCTISIQVARRRKSWIHVHESCLIIRINDGNEIENPIWHSKNVQVNWSGRIPCIHTLWTNESQSGFQQFLTVVSSQMVKSNHQLKKRSCFFQYVSSTCISIIRFKKLQLNDVKPCKPAQFLPNKTRNLKKNQI